MSKITVNALVSGGKATAGPPLGPALGPTGVNIGKVISEINQKTKDFAGVDVPVKVIVDPKTKEFEIEVGVPPTSALIKKEIGIEKGAGKKDEFVGDIGFDKIIKIAKMKMEKLGTDSIKNATLQVIGTCVSMGIKVDSKDPRDVTKEIKGGKYDDLLS